MPRTTSTLLCLLLLSACTEDDTGRPEGYGGIDSWGGEDEEWPDEEDEQWPDEEPNESESGDQPDPSEPQDPQDPPAPPDPEAPIPTTQGSEQDDHLQGANVAEEIYGKGGVDQLDGGAGDDLLDGGAQLDVLRGEAGDDTLRGGADGDVLDGGPGLDLLEGGSGSDTYVHVRGEGDTLIVDSSGDHDRLVLIDYAEHEAQIDPDGDDLLITLPDTQVRIQGHFAAGAVEDLVFEAADKDVFEELDYGIYWYGPGGSAAKQLPARQNPHFDPHAPTLIFAHGWSHNAVDNGYRDDFDWGDTSGPSGYLAQAWIAAGWNVGVFNWQQFADEGEVKDAEAKIWTASGPRDMRWRSAGSGHVQADMGGRSVGELFLREYAETMATLHSEEVRLLGHSLGNQLVTVLAHEAWQRVDGPLSERLMPTRLALLDGFWSKGAKDYLGGQWTGERARELVDVLRDRGVVFEAYRSSGVGSNPFIGDANDALLAKTCFVELRPWYHGPFDFSAKHIAAAWHYMWAYQFAAPGDGLGGTVCSPRADDGDIALGMAAAYHWRHEEGVYTMSPGDDLYLRVN